MDATVSVAFRQRPGYAVAQVYRAMRHAMDRELRELDLTTPQWGTLACLDESDGLCGAEMARIYGVTPQTMHTILQNLEHAGLIVKEPLPENGTVLAVRLTATGRARFRDALARVEAVQERMLHGLNAGEREHLTDLLNRCVDTLHRDGELPSESPCLD